MDEKRCEKTDRFTQFAGAGSLMAVKDADLNLNDENADRVGVWIGSESVEWKHLKINIKTF